MTFSLLAQDLETGAIGGVAATCSYCVGGWVLRGDLNAGMSASQGAAPSTFWGEDVLSEMRAGHTAPDAVARVTGADSGREYRQLAALDLAGQGAAFSGARNTPVVSQTRLEHGVASGNMLANGAVVEKMADGYLQASGAFQDRLMAALVAAQAAGSDRRGLLSAALLILHPDQAPLTLRIDYHPEDPVAALGALLERATTGDYGAWARQVPVLNDRERVLQDTSVAAQTPDPEPQRS